MSADRPTIRVLDDAEGASQAAAEHVARTLATAIDRRGRADWATTGGSAPVGIYRRLAVPPLRDQVAWAAVHLWWGDDRYVPHDHPESNVLPAEQVLIGAAAFSGQSGYGEDGLDVLSGRDPGAPIPADNVHPFPIPQALGANLGPAWAATSYAVSLRESGIAVEDGWPVFDLVLLGVGPDGHILSAFPGSAPLDDERAWTLAVPAPSHVEPHVSRVTLNPRIVDHARDVLVVVHGASKAAILERIATAPRDLHELPALYAWRPGATWIVDRAAAANLPAAVTGQR